MLDRIIEVAPSLGITDPSVGPILCYVIGFDCRHINQYPKMDRDAYLNWRMAQLFSGRFSEGETFKRMFPRADNIDARAETFATVVKKTEFRFIMKQISLMRTHTDYNRIITELAHVI